MTRMRNRVHTLRKKIEIRAGEVISSASVSALRRLEYDDVLTCTLYSAARHRKWFDYIFLCALCWKSMISKSVHEKYHRKDT